MVIHNFVQLREERSSLELYPQPPSSLLYCRGCQLLVVQWIEEHQKLRYCQHKYIGTEHLCEHKNVVSKPFVSWILAGCYMGNCLVWNPNGYIQVGST